MKITTIHHPNDIAATAAVYITDATTNWEALPINETQKQYALQQIGYKCFDIVFNTDGYITAIVYVEDAKTPTIFAESCRLMGAKIANTLNDAKVESVAIANYTTLSDAGLLCAEGTALASYQFLKYKTTPVKKLKTLQTIGLFAVNTTEAQVAELQILVDAVYITRDLVNEPVIYLTAPQLSIEIEKLGKEAGFSVTVLDKAQIEAEKMGGLLAVNYGSPIEPRFNILEWKPSHAKNTHPIVLVGKGVVYDTGGLSLKPTLNSMDHMKCDMGGAAVVAATLYAVAKLNLPLHIVGLIPSTDNRPGGNAYTPGDVITMRSGHTVEVLNTDAEGRLILADALDYAKQYQPELVIDFATLTGAALITIGMQGVLLMGNANETTKNQFKQSGEEVYERLAELPLWDEYKQQLESSIADLKNIGGSNAGSITAGKFLEHFTDYPWMHVDLSMAWHTEDMGYRLKNGTGVGTRLCYNFLKKRTNLA